MVLFQASESNHGNVTVNWANRPLKEFSIYAESYHKAGKKLIESLLSQNHINDIDACPIVFLYRHSIELYLKSICLKGNELFEAKNKQLQLNGNVMTLDRLFKSHKLLPLLEVVKQISDARNNESWDLNESWGLPDESACFENYSDFEAAIREIDDIDAGSYTFRYPYSKEKKGASLSQEDSSFDMNLFKVGVEVIIEFLDCISVALDQEIQPTLEEVYQEQDHSGA